MTSLSCIQLFCDPMDCSPPGSSLHGILLAKIPRGDESEKEYSPSASRICEAEDIRGPASRFQLHLGLGTSELQLPSAALHFVRTVLLRDLRNFACSLSVDLFPSGCEGKLGVALESLQGLRDLT